jgi:cytochrome c-type biogenesis protein CcmH/NrfF
MLLVGLLIAFLYLRRRSTAKAVGDDRLSAEERARLDELLKE